MKIVAFIFARGGSKGLPGKNLRVLNGHPLIAWSIRVAKEVDRIDRVIVSTDDDEIADTSLRYGAEVPFIRPSDLAEDESPEWLAWQHALKYLVKEEDYIPDIMISLPATSPLRSKEDVDDCIDLYLSGSVDGVITVSEANRNPFFNMVYRDEDGFSDLVCKSEEAIHRRQDAPVVYDMTTVCYVLSPTFVLNNSSLLSGTLKSLVIPKERSIDIDDSLDFKIAELTQFQNKNYQ